jgi:MOSC domain-containing protein YiiM
MAPRITAVSVVYELHPNEFRPVGTTAIDKREVPGPVRLDVLGFAGDTQCDREAHGGVYQAAYAYADEDAAWWAAELGREIPPGLFGENLRTSDVEVTGAEIGERWRLGDGDAAALVEVTSPRIPCQTFAARMGEPHWIKRFAAHGAPGAYLRVLRPGSVSTGDAVTVEHRPGHGVTVGALFLARDPQTWSRLLAAADEHDLDLNPPLREVAQRRVAASA